MQIDSDGFMRITRKNTTGDSDTSKTKSPKKDKPAVKFKKGTWKHWLWKKLKRSVTPKKVSKFHDTNLENITVYRPGKPKAILHKKKITKEQLNLLKSKFSDAYILINTGNSMYMKITLTAYLKLMDVDKISIHSELEVCPDGYDESYVLAETDLVVSSINGLCHYINEERNRINSTYELQTQISWYQLHTFKHRIMVSKVDGSFEYFKDINNFLKYFELYLI